MAPETASSNDYDLRVAKRVRYSGRVQGVGFRYTTQHLSQRFDVHGFVRNCPDGEVELVAEGVAAEVEGFLAAIAERMAANIERATVADVPPSGHRGFGIRP